MNKQINRLMHPNLTDYADQCNLEWDKKCSEYERWNERVQDKKLELLNDWGTWTEFFGGEMNGRELRDLWLVRNEEPKSEFHRLFMEFWDNHCEFMAKKMVDRDQV